MTLRGMLTKEAERRRIPLQTLEQVKATLEQAKRTNADKAMARAMLRVGRITDEALLWIGDNYPNVWE